MIEVPGALVEADPLKNTLWPVAGDEGENEKVAVGAAAAVTVMVWFALAV